MSGLTESASPGGPLAGDQRGPAAVPASRVHADRLLDRVGLGLKGLDEAGQQPSAVMRDDDRGNGMPGLRCGSWQGVQHRLVSWPSNETAGQSGQLPRVTL